MKQYAIVELVDFIPQERVGEVMLRLADVSSVMVPDQPETKAEVTLRSGMIWAVSRDSAQKLRSLLEGEEDG